MTDNSGLFTNDSRVVGDYFYLPSRAGRMAMEELERRKTQSIRFEWDVPCLDDYLTPMVPGDLISVLGRPGMAKSAALTHLARAADRELIRHGARDRLVVYATWETLVEEFVALNVAHISGYSLEMIGRGDIRLERMQSAISQTVQQRIAVFGKSMKSGKGVHTLDDLETALSWMVDEGMPPALLLVDYLQRMPSGFGTDRATKVSENHERLKDIAIGYRVPVVVAVQAKRDVDQYKGLRLPQMDDGQWTSVIEQTSDKVVSVTRPIRYMEQGSTVETADGQYSVDEQTLGFQVVKQRFGRAGKIFVINLDAPSSTLSERDAFEEVL